MIMTDEFLEWAREKAETDNTDTYVSMFNFVIYTLCGLKLRHKIQVIAEILLGQKFCMYISRKQGKSN